METMLMVLCVALLATNFAVLGLCLICIYKNVSFSYLQQRYNTGNEPAPTPLKKELSEEEKRAKKRYDDEQAAFEEMMNFNVNKVYGINNGR